jgi:hypothetical protein
MQNDKEHLKFDLRFLDASPLLVDREEATKIIQKKEAAFVQGSKKAKYWGLLGDWFGPGLVAVFIIGALISENLGKHQNWQAPHSSNTQQPNAFSEFDPTKSPTVQLGNDFSKGVENSGATATVNNGQFRCSLSDSNQADAMSPQNEFELNRETSEFKRRGQALDSLKNIIESSRVNEYSDQYSIDRFNAMIDQYNMQLTQYKVDYTSYQAHLNLYNQRVDARNNYLLTHCRRAY